MIKDQITYPCPQCGATIPEPADPTANLLVCPNCGNQFFIKRATTPRRTFEHRNDDFAERVHDLARGRRRLIRYRSYFVIGGLACFILLGQVIYLLIKFRWTPKGQSVMAGLAIVFLIGLAFFAHKAMQLSQFLRHPLVGKPVKPPDFESLR